MSELKIIADTRESEQTRVALLENGKLAEIFIEYNDFPETSGSKFSRQGDIFKARIDTVLPGINAAFVSIAPHTKIKNLPKNTPRNAFLYLSDFLNKTVTPSPGTEVIVQIVKNARKNKAPMVSARISVPGRWLVLVPGSNEIGVSRRIFNNDERKRLKKIAENIKSELKDFGVIVRTAAEGIDEKFLRSDIQSLVKLWSEIQDKAKKNHAPCLLYRDVGALGKVLRDEISGKIDEIIIDDSEEFEHVQDFISRFYPECPVISLYKGITPIFEFYGIEGEIEKALDRKVWLKSGAYLVIDQTEALTVIDVNTGKFTSAPDMRHTVLSVNLEAADEIARQLRLRAVGGIVVVDFIDMDYDEDRHQLLERFEKVLCHDRLKARVFSITQLGLVELTRKRARPDLKSIMTRNCPLCGDNGWVIREENIAMNIKRFIRKITMANNAQAFLIQTSTHMAKYINDYLPDWEEEFNRRIFIEGVPNFEWGKYRVEIQGSLEYVEDYFNSKML